MIKQSVNAHCDERSKRNNAIANDPGALLKSVSQRLDKRKPQRMDNPKPSE
jgi:hypothetical protein